MILSRYCLHATITTSLLEIPTLAFQVPPFERFSMKGQQLELRTPSAIGNNVQLLNIQRKTYFARRVPYLRNMNKNDDQDRGLNNSDDEKKKNTAGEIFDSIWSSPFFSTFLFWTPFIANDKLRLRFFKFVSDYLDLTIAIPVSIIGVVVVGIYIGYVDMLNDVELAKYATDELLNELREIRRIQMAAGGGASDEKDFKITLGKYEVALRGELQLRQKIAGFPWKIPEGPDKAGAEQFLGMEINESGNLVPK